MTEPTARCLIRELDELFVEEVVDPDEGRVYRPFGREVEPDESPRRPSGRRSGRRSASTSHG